MGTINCVNIYGETVFDRKTRFYQTCRNGMWSETMLVPDDDICYMGSIIPSVFCGGLPPQPECSFSGYQCIDAGNVLTNKECTSRYVLLVLFILEWYYVKMEFFPLLFPSFVSLIVAPDV